MVIVKSIAEVDLNACEEGHKELMAQDRDLLKPLVKEALDQILQAEMTEFLGLAPGERNATLAGSRAGYYERRLITGWARSNRGYHAIGPASFRPRCSSVSSAARRPRCRRW